MSNNYEKKYDIGNISPDLPRANYIHELPLLSFSDVQNSINLSLVFNYARHEEDIAENKNSFFIAPGFKLNMQKKLVFDESYDLSKIYESDGKFIELKTNEDMVNIFTFDDDSQRILRRIPQSTPTPVPPDSNEIVPETGNTTYTHVVEYPDFSKEVYDSNGKIIEVYDKYSDTPYLTYAYNEYSRLTSISYKGTKVISLSYESDRLNTVTYNNCSSTFNYNTDGTLSSIEHYTGVVYSFDFTDGYKIEAKKDENTVINSSTVCRDIANKTISLSDHYGNVVTYKFNYSIDLNYSDENNIVEITDTHGVTTRYQYSNDKMLYSYEINNDIISDESNFVGCVNIHRTLDNVDTPTTYGALTINDGISMWYDNNDSTTLVYSNSDTATDQGYYLLTGWAKNGNDIVNSGDNNVCISDNNYRGYNETKFWVDASPTKQWYFFAYKFYKDYSTVYVYQENSNALELKDVRITFLTTAPSEEEDEEYNSHINFSEHLLINDIEEIYLTDAMYFYSKGDSNYLIEGNVTVSDIMKYKLSKKRNGSCSEIYVDNCKFAIVGTTDFKILHNENYISVSDFKLATRTYSKDKISLTVIDVDENNQSTDIEKICIEKMRVEGATEKEVLKECLDNNINVKTVTSDGVTTTYERNSQGLVTKETVLGLYRHDTSYSDTLITVTDIDPATEQTISTTKYHLNSDWGGVNKIEVFDESGTVVSVIEDTYTSDMGVLKQKAFDVNPTSINTFTYSNGKLNSITHGDLNYGFGYTSTKGELESVSKNGTSIEHHTYEESNGETTVTSYYPLQDSAVYSLVQRTDVYGRLIGIDGMVSNTYDVLPLYVNDAYSIVGVDNSSGKLATSTDAITGNVTKYAYEKDRISRIGEFNSAGTKISEEIILYDNINRVTCIGCALGSSSNYLETITYATQPTDPSADNRIETHSFSRNGTLMASSQSTYDQYKRLSRKIITVGANEITKDYTYDHTKLSGITHYKNGTAIHNYLLESDVQLRTTTEQDNVSGGYINNYVYDSYGQLIRENNDQINKTICYTYDGIGNITKAQNYSYTTGEISSDPTSEETYYYDSSNPDRLSLFKGKSISYDANGYVTQYDGWTYTWSKGRLIKKTSGTRTSGLYTYTFSYNARGQRTQKNYSFFPGTIYYPDYLARESTTYKYDPSGRLAEETISSTNFESGTVNRKLVYLYEGNEIIGIIYTKANVTDTFYYDKNPKGDVIGILDSSGNTVVKYSYDAWGNHNSYGSSNGDLAHVNPIRYRGYYYDVDIGLYYLNSRYYNPQWRRFISPDSTEYLDPETPNGLNLYCYCNNDPVNYADPSGCAPEWWQWVLGIIGISLVAVAAGMAILGTGGVAAFGMGALIGSASVGTVGAGIGAAVGYATGGVDGILGGALAGFGIGAIVGFAVGGAIGYHSFVTAPSRSHSVYISKSGNTVNYAGRTNNIVRRTTEHLRAGKGVVPQEVARKLTLKQARGLEQALINRYGLLKNGGTLINEINSIALSNPIYNKAVMFGRLYILTHFWKFPHP